MTQLTHFIGVAGLIWAWALCGGEAPVSKVDFGFDVASVVSPAGEQKPIARVFTKYIYPGDVMAGSAGIDAEAVSRLRGLILHGLMERLAEKNEIAASDEEVEQFSRRLASGADQATALKPENETSEARTAMKSLGAAFVKQWKIDKKLYDLYGGAVIFQQGNPQEPVGAYRGLLEDAERTKVLEIYDKENRDRVWEYFARDHGPWRVPNDKVDFSKPWWLKIAGE